MKQLTKTCYASDDNYVACALTEDGRFACLENDPDGVLLIKICDTLKEAKQYVQDYEDAVKEFNEVFK